MQRELKINENGRRIGEDHQRAKLTDAEVELVRDLRDDGLSYGQIALRMEIPKSTVRDICTCRTRAQLCVGVRIIDEPGDSVLS